MSRHVIGIAIVLQLTASTLAAAAGAQVLLIARDLKNHPLPGIRFSYDEVKSRPTNQDGATELDLPPDQPAGRQIKLSLVSGFRRADEWFLVSPEINVPNDGGSAAVVLMRRSEFRQFAADARDAPRLATSRLGEPTAEDRMRALVATAASHGLTVEQLNSAIRSFAETQDPADRGIAAYLEGQYPKAEELLNGAAEKKERDLAETLRYLGAAQYQQRKYRAAADSFRKALALGGEDAPLLSWLGTALTASAQWTEAEVAKRRALALAEKSYGPDQPQVAAVLNNLGVLLLATNRLTEAEPLLRRALAIDEKTLGPEHPDVAADLNNLALLLKAAMRLAEAEPLFRRALAINEKNYGPEDNKVALCLDNLGMLLLATNHFAEAEPLMRRALAINEKSLGPEDLEVATNLNNLSMLLKATNRLAQAEPLLRRSLAIAEKTLGPEDLTVATSLNNLGLLLKARNHLAEAEPLMRRALAIEEKNYGQDHPQVAICLDNLAQLLQDMNRIPEAEPLLRRAIAIAEKSYGPEHPELASYLGGLANLLQVTHRFAEAEPLMRRTLAIREKNYGSESAAVAINLNNLAQLLEAVNCLTEAEPLERRSFVILVKLSRRSRQPHPQLLTALRNYKELLRAMGKPPAEIEMTINELVRSPR